MKGIGRELLHAHFAVLFASFLEGEGGFADAGLGGLVVNLVDVSQDSGDLGLDFSDDLFHFCEVLVDY